MPLTADELLYGFHDEPGIVGAWLAPDNDSRIDLYRRVDGELRREGQEFFPFLHVADAALLEGFRPKHWVRELGGPGYYRAICIVTRWRDLWDAVQLVTARHQARAAGRAGVPPQSPFLLRADPAAQYFLQTGKTSFKGMEFDGLHRMQITVAAIASRGFGNPERESDRVVCVALSDSRGWSALISNEEEPALLRACIEQIRRRDPDVIEGHHFLSIDLPYLTARCALHGIPFAIGRKETEPAPAAGRGREGEAERSAATLHGRHLVDTAYFLHPDDRERMDWSALPMRRLLEQQGFAMPHRTIVPQERIGWYWKNERRTLESALQNRLIEIDFVCSSLSRSSFALAQCVPMNYGALFTTGTSAKIELLMLREYIRAHAAIPRPVETMPTSGGFTALYRTGLYDRVLDVDVESMYPSIMITRGFEPASDALHVFIPLLEKLTRVRLERKRAMLAEESLTRKKELEAHQYALKILINSFYGYLGYGFALFNDPAVSDAVVREGQAILKNLIRAIREGGGAPIEVDTDGIYFVPPAYIDDEEKERNFLERLATAVPEGIRLAIGGRYKRMLSYKIKNYALLDYRDRIRIRGSSLSSRNMEKFARAYIEAAVECLLKEDVPGLQNLYRSAIADLQSHALDIRELARVETLRESTEEYTSGIARRGAVRKAHSAVHEALMRSYRYAKAGERIAYYFAGTDPALRPHEMSKLVEDWSAAAPDENVAYYIRRVAELNAKFEEFFEPADFLAVFSIADELFAPDLARIRIRNRVLQE